MKSTSFLPFLKSGVTSAILAVSVLLPSSQMATAQQSLPQPYVSRALDALLIPVDDEVASAFGLPGAGGLLLLAVQPDGLADSVGLMPGDVIDAVDGRQFVGPIELDKFILFNLQRGITDFQFQGLSEGAAVAAVISITLEAWEEFIEVTTISSWESYSYESFSFTEYYEEYSEEITVSYEESLVEIEETISSEEYSEEFESIESTEESTDVSEEASEDEMSSEEMVPDESSEDDMVEEEDFCASNPDDPACAGEEEAIDEEPAEEEFIDEGGDEGGDDDGEVIEE